MTAARLLEELEDDDHALARGGGVANSVEGGLVCEAVLLAGAPPGLPRIWPRRTLPRRGARGGHLWRVARRAAGREVAAATARLIKHYSRSGAWVEITPAALAGPRALAATATHRGPHSSPTCLSDAPEPSDCSERLAHLCQESPETRGITQSCVMHALRAGRGAHCASVFVRRPSLLEMTALFIYECEVISTCLPKLSLPSPLSPGRGGARAGAAGVRDVRDVWFIVMSVGPRAICHACVHLLRLFPNIEG